MKVLIVNTGSSSLKWSVLDADSEAVDARGESSWEGGDPDRHQEEVRAALRAVPPVDVVGHRVVHGGDRFRAAVLVDDEVRQAIADLAELAPLHNPAAVAGIDAVSALLPRVPQVASFDTAFHATIPDPAALYPLPWEWTARWGLRRFGFHGLSVQYALRRSRELLGRVPPRLVVCHLGAGCSVTALADGRSVDTSMGFTPLEGVMMARRSGSVDPGLLLYLLDRQRLSVAALDHALEQRSGLLGVSGVSADLRAVLAAAERGDPRAALARDMFVHRVVGAVGAMTATLGGLDALVFTGGIGEHSDPIRRAVAASCAYLGLRLAPSEGSPADRDPLGRVIPKARAGEARVSAAGTPPNPAPPSAAPDRDVASADSAVRALVITAREDLAVLAEVTRLLGRGASG